MKLYSPWVRFFVRCHCLSGGAGHSGWARQATTTSRRVYSVLYLARPVNSGSCLLFRLCCLRPLPCAPSLRFGSQSSIWQPLRGPCGKLAAGEIHKTCDWRQSGDCALPGRHVGTRGGAEGDLVRRLAQLNSGLSGRSPAHRYTDKSAVRLTAPTVRAASLSCQSPLPRCEHVLGSGDCLGWRCQTIVVLVLATAACAARHQCVPAGSREREEQACAVRGKTTTRFYRRARRYRSAESRV